MNKYILDTYIFYSWNLDCDSGLQGVFFCCFAKNSMEPRVAVYIP